MSSIQNGLSNINSLLKLDFPAANFERLLVSKNFPKMAKILVLGKLTHMEDMRSHCPVKEYSFYREHLQLCYITGWLSYIFPIFSDRPASNGCF